MRFNFLLR